MANYNPEEVKQANKVKADIVAAAKNAIKAQRAASPVDCEKFPALVCAFEDYAEECEARRIPMTWAGFALAGGISYDTLDRMRKGDLDYVVTEYRITHDLDDNADTAMLKDGTVIPLLLPSEIIEKCCSLRLMNQLESNCYQLKGNQVGSIFGLKARFGWQDEHQPLYVDKQLVIADKDRANEMLSMLKSE